MERWRTVVELTWDWQEGDTPLDKVSLINVAPENRDRGTGQELDRAKQSLNNLIGGKPFAHFHILELPHKCHEFD